MRPESTDASLDPRFLVGPPHLVTGPWQLAKLHRRSKDPILRGSELRCLLPQLQRVKHLAGDVKSAPRPGGLHFVNVLLNNAPLHTEQAAEPVYVRPTER